MKPKKLVTIDQHILAEEHLHPEATGEFTLLLHNLTFAIRLIAKEVRRAGINNILGLTETKNFSGDVLRKLDKYADYAIFRAMSFGGHFCAMVSEESNDILKIPKEFKKGKYVLLYDPIDGSTNIDVNITIGSIFSIYQRIEPKKKTDGTLDDVLQPGYKQVASAYALYGSSTILVYTTGHGVNCFTYDPTIGEFFLTESNIKIPQRGSHYSCNEGNYYKWNKNIQEYIKYIKTPSSDKTKPYTLRYIATAVADIHRILHYGGIYLYPSEVNAPDGKIRLIYEANPLAYIIEQAGGKAITDNGRVLETIPNSIHQKVPFYAGSPENIDEFLEFLK